MRTIVMAAIGAVSLFTISCQQGGGENHANHDQQAPAADTAVHAEAKPAEVKTVAVAFADADAKVSGPIHEAIGHYFHLKNALVEDNAANAASGAKAMAASLQKIDKSFFTADQKKAYDELESGLKEHASQIASATDIKVQRSHFIGLSTSVYALVKSFGAGKAVYHDFCPMANDDKGALWVSEVADIKNPYFGAGMLTCGSVEEEIK